MPQGMDEAQLLAEQVAYYRARAGEYDEWFFRRGRYDRGDAHRAAWSAEAARVEAALREEAPLGDVLELACGTGLWTRHLAGIASHVTAVDASPEVIAINRQRVGSPAVEYVVADIFEWKPTRKYDFVLFAFWLSHVPAARFESFWRLVRMALRPAGRAFFIDGLAEPESTARDHATPGTGGRVSRRLEDGREFEIVKVFYEPESLTERLLGLGWRGAVRATSRFFLFGCVTPATGARAGSPP
jgi:demethylmenaquinone methyltransferase/2-methoxy-6-polyprenyl-1,4-benzoquinol methylase